jgi:hypothetical protein
MHVLSILLEINFVKKVAILFAVLTLASGPALSEVNAKQTPENAYRFMNVVATEHNLGFLIETGENAGTLYNVGTYSGTYLERSVTGRFRMNAFKVKAVEGDACHATFKWDYDPNAPLFDGSFNLRDDADRTVTQVSDVATRTEFVVDWSKVAGVRVNYSTEVVLVGVAKVVAPTTALATRLQYAFEFLRNACDKTAATGF